MHRKIEWDVVITAALIGIIMLTDVKVDFGNGTTAAEGAIMVMLMKDIPQKI